MTNDQPKPQYVFLDTEEDRKQLILEIAKVRQAVLRVVDSVPEAEWYEPRYHTWTLAATLGHLNFLDNVSMFLIQAALVGFRPRMHMRTVNRLNNFTARLFHKRLINASVKSIQANQKRIGDFILRLPVSKFSTPVFDPPADRYITVEQSIQERFLFHWQHHLDIMREFEGIPRSERTDSV